MDAHYHYGLLYLIHLLIGADKYMDEREMEALELIKEKERIPSKLIDTFEQSLSGKTERDIYCTGMDWLNKCSREQKLEVFSTLYKLSEIDGRVHEKEIRLLLYSIRDAGIPFDEVVSFATKDLDAQA